MTTQLLRHYFRHCLKKTILVKVSLMPRDTDLADTLIDLALVFYLSLSQLARQCTGPYHFDVQLFSLAFCVLNANKDLLLTFVEADQRKSGRTKHSKAFKTFL